MKEKGVHPDRIKAKGMGENDPIKGVGGVVLTAAYISKLKTQVEKDAALQRNRRTDFKVIGDDFVPPSAQAPEGTK